MSFQVAIKQNTKRWGRGWYLFTFNLFKFCAWTELVNFNLFKICSWTVQWTVCNGFYYELGQFFSRSSKMTNKIKLKTFFFWKRKTSSLLLEVSQRRLKNNLDKLSPWMTHRPVKENNLVFDHPQMLDELFFTPQVVNTSLMGYLFFTPKIVKVPLTTVFLESKKKKVTEASTKVLRTTPVHGLTSWT